MANETKITEGPWAWEGDALYGKDDGYTVAVIDEAYFPEENEFTEENKSAISAAPEMVSVLEWIDLHYDNQDMGHSEFRIGAAVVARAALAKARGATQ